MRKKSTVRQLSLPIPPDSRLCKHLHCSVNSSSYPHRVICQNCFIDVLKEDLTVFERWAK